MGRMGGLRGLGRLGKLENWRNIIITWKERKFFEIILYICICIFSIWKCLLGKLAVRYSLPKLCLQS